MLRCCFSNVVVLPMVKANDYTESKWNWNTFTLALNKSNSSTHINYKVNQVCLDHLPSICKRNRILKFKSWSFSVICLLCEYNMPTILSLNRWDVNEIMFALRHSSCDIEKKHWKLLWCQICIFTFFLFPRNKEKNKGSRSPHHSVYRPSTLLSFSCDTIRFVYLIWLIQIRRNANLYVRKIICINDDQALTRLHDNVKCKR